MEDWTQALQQALEPGEDDTPPLDVMQLAGLMGRSKVPLEQSGHLLAMRDAYAGLDSGRLTRDEYLAKVNEVLGVFQTAVDVFELPHIKRVEAKQPEEKRLIIERTREDFKRLLGAALEMKNGDPRRGLDMLEASMKGLDETQDDALNAVES